MNKMTLEQPPDVSIDIERVGRFKSGNEWIVRATFRSSDDGRRTTCFYSANKSAAEYLHAMLTPLAIDAALKAQGEPVAYAEFADSGCVRMWSREYRDRLPGTNLVPLYTAPPADDRPTWEEVRDIIVRAVDWGYDEGFARANDEDASAVPIDDKCARIIAEFRKEKDRG